MQYKSATSRAPILSISIILSIILIDQLTKALIIRFIPYDPHSYPTPIFEWGGDFLRIIHVRNLELYFLLVVHGQHYSILSFKDHTATTSTLLNVPISSTKYAICTCSSKVAMGSIIHPNACSISCCWRWNRKYD